LQTARTALEQFLAAFSQLQLDMMLDCFDEDATAFFPVEHARERLNGKAEIREAFARVLSHVRATGAAKMRLDAEELREQPLGDVSVFTFHLRGSHLSRRTFVLRRRGDEWKIVQFHGSNAG
jgi:ketosteroid isomerase-like protein